MPTILRGSQQAGHDVWEALLLHPCTPPWLANTVRHLAAPAQPRGAAAHAPSHFSGEEAEAQRNAVWLHRNAAPSDPRGTCGSRSHLCTRGCAPCTRSMHTWPGGCRLTGRHNAGCHSVGSQTWSRFGENSSERAVPGNQPSKFRRGAIGHLLSDPAWEQKPIPDSCALALGSEANDLWQGWGGGGKGTQQRPRAAGNAKAEKHTVGTGAPLLVSGPRERPLRALVQRPVLPELKVLRTALGVCL